MGKLIALEGLDGSGKTSVINGVVSLLSQLPHKVCIAKTHGGYDSYWKGYEAVRQHLGSIRDPISEHEDQILRAVEFIHYASNFLPTQIAEYDYVFTDRYLLGKSVLAETLSGNTAGAVKILNASREIGILPIPDYTIFLKISPESAHQRVIDRGLQLEVKESISMLEKTAQIFQENLEDVYSHEFFEIDASQNLDNVIKSVMNLVI